MKEDLEKTREFYKELRDLAVKYEKHIWTASQPKRPKTFFRTRIPEKTGDIFTIDYIDMIFTKAKQKQAQVAEWLTQHAQNVWSYDMRVRIPSWAI